MIKYNYIEYIRISETNVFFNIVYIKICLYCAKNIADCFRVCVNNI